MAGRISLLQVLNQSCSFLQLHRMGVTMDVHGHSTEAASSAVEVQLVALKHQVHVHLGEIVCGVPDVERTLPNPGRAANNLRLWVWGTWRFDQCLRMQVIMKSCPGIH